MYSIWPQMYFLDLKVCTCLDCWLNEWEEIVVNKIQEFSEEIPKKMILRVM